MRWVLRRGLNVTVTMTAYRVLWAIVRMLQVINRLKQATGIKQSTLAAGASLPLQQEHAGFRLIGKLSHLQARPNSTTSGFRMVPGKCAGVRLPISGAESIIPDFSRPWTVSISFFNP